MQSLMRLYDQVAERSGFLVHRSFGVSSARIRVPQWKR